ncbi:CHY zinc finger protein [Besnoitia besnoiti]|uniref:CHY zinc finger protein n=1 Tax=Besnoitia besnoiti TaxID=94643 RepID=A0A2A9M3G1_BESBE|nr:CHY zinc finger protein [Besnoitia besnoiti]PFH32495.1 CHY zinc finger protein [Besnoitia besnoiti]
MEDSGLDKHRGPGLEPRFHGEASSGSLQQNRTAGMPLRLRRQREVPCRFFLQGRCVKTNSCPFLHNPSLGGAQRNPESSHALRSPPEDSHSAADLPAEPAGETQPSCPSPGSGPPSHRSQLGRDREVASRGGGSQRGRGGHTCSARPRRPESSLLSSNFHCMEGQDGQEEPSAPSVTVPSASGSAASDALSRGLAAHDSEPRGRRRPNLARPEGTSSSTAVRGSARRGRGSCRAPRRDRTADGSKEARKGGNEGGAATEASASPASAQSEGPQPPSRASGVSRPAAGPPRQAVSRPPCLPGQSGFPGGPARNQGWSWEEERLRLQRLYGASFSRIPPFAEPVVRPRASADGAGSEPARAAPQPCEQNEGEIPAAGLKEPQRAGDASVVGKADDGKREDGREEDRSPSAPREEKQPKRGGASAGEIADIIRLTHIPTDPDFDSTLLPNGLTVEITVRAQYPGIVGQRKATETTPHERTEGAVASSFPQNSAAEGRAASPAEPGKEEDQGGAGGKQASSAENHGEQLARGIREQEECDSDQEKKTSAPAASQPPHDITSLRVCNAELGEFLVETIPKVFQEYVLKNPHESFLVHRALKFVDRHLATVFALSRPRGPTTAQTSSGGAQEPPGAHKAGPAEEEKKGEWTLDEQKRLEEGLVWYRRVADPVTKWKLIGSFVRTRSARECAQRFRDCREAILRRAEAVRADAAEADGGAAAADEEAEESEADESPVSAPASASAGGSATSDGGKELQGAAVGLVGFQLEGASAMHPAALKVLVACERCKKPADVRLVTPKDGTSLEVTGTATDCATCHLRMVVRFQPKIAFLSTSGGHAGDTIATVETIQCRMRDLLPSDYMVTCDKCAATIKIKEVFSGAPRIAICRHCHNKILLCYQSAFYSGRAEADAGMLSAVSMKGLSVVNNSEKKKKAKDELTLKIGTPLPDNGTCKHYKKSFRWLRFPCCGKAFPCDLCHDSSADHDHVWATRMICGFCSKEQAFGNRPCDCGHALTKDGSTSHWEGGKGCRDAVRMNRNDSKKYKLLSKQRAEAAGGNKTGGRK